ncbi:MAG: 2-dehydro-3-deoxyphosphooctonate aldolase [Alphaproteobacteria bacterium]|nr:2-dehydro-3-deoxyphosphooctonate aldolase [Alphaproteobacteria bacterium]
MRVFVLLVAAFAALCAPLAAAQSVSLPNSARSRAAEARVAPRLAQEMAAANLRLGAPVFVRIVKEVRTLELFVRSDVDGRFYRFRTYPICSFSGALGPKLREGDGQAPEGVYLVRPRQLNPVSSYHLSFDLGFPNAFDRANGRTGSALMVHGNCVSIGCYAMGDPAIEEIWTAMTAALRGGQAAVPVHAFPFAMTPQALAARATNPNAAFWADLAPIWAAFERDARPPAVVVRNGRYALRT